MFLKNTDRVATDLSNLPWLSISSPVSNIPHLTDLDIDLNMPTDQNFRYYSSHDFHSDHDIIECSSDAKSFSALHCNIRSLAANYDNMLTMLSDLNFSFSLIGLSETKIKSDKNNLLNISIPGHNFLSQPSSTNAGGVGFYVKSGLNHTLRQELTTTHVDFQALWIEIQCDGQQNLICGVLYRHPNGSFETFMDYVNSTVEKIYQENKLCLIMGDFNVDLLRIDSHPGSENFINTLGSFFFQPHILQPTRLTDHSSTLIDNIFFNSIEHFIISGSLVYDLTDHLPNFIILNKFSSLPSSVKVYKRDYFKFNQASLISEIHTVDWQIVFTSDTDPSCMFDCFYSKISQIVDKHIPIKQLSRRELKFKSKPWITSAIKRSIKVKNNFYKKFLKTKSSYYHSKFKYYRNKINHLLKLSKRKYYNQYFLENSNDIKRVWNGIKQIIHCKPKASQKAVKIIKNNVELIDPLKIAEAFNTYFSNVGSNLADLIPTVQKSPMSYLKSPVDENVFIFPTTASEIENEISSLKSGKAVGPFSVPISILKILKTVISKPLAMLFNASFSAGIVPAKFKIANVVPVYKKDSQTCLSNYRPISLLSIFNKLQEKLMYNRLYISLR